MFNEAGQHILQPFIEAREHVGGAIFQITDVDPSFKNRAVSPNIRSLQVGHPNKFDVFRTHFRAFHNSERRHGAIRVRGYNGRPVAALAMIV